MLETVRRASPAGRKVPLPAFWAGAMDYRLAHQHSAFINFRRYVPDPKEHGFRWVDVKHYLSELGDEAIHD